MRILHRLFTRSAVLVATGLTLSAACSSARVAATGTGGEGPSTSSVGATASGSTSAGTGGTGGTGGTPADGGSTPALTNPAPGGKLFAGVNLWRIDWEGARDYFVSGADFAAAGNPWQPALMTDLAPFHVVRFMDWNATNDSNNPQAIWSTRKPKSGDQTAVAVAFEWQIDLCNRAHTDYWLTIPHEANLADYPANLAQLVHDQLDPSLRVYVEWSNEVWNGSFPQNQYAAGKAKSLGLGKQTYAAYQVYASVRVWEAFEAVFGQGSPRLVKVLAGQAAWNGPCTDLTAVLADSTINPKRTMPTVFAVAPYFSGTSIQALQAAIPGLAQGLKDNATCAMGAGLPLVSYEGGADAFSAPNNGCTTLMHDPGMHDLYTSFLDLLASNMKGPFNHYTNSGACWGLKEKTGDPPSASPKYQAITDWLSAHP